jgi:hypothetical protein
VSDEEIIIDGLRLKRDKVASYRVYRTSLGEMAEVRFLLDEDSRVDSTDMPTEIKT